MKRAWTVLALAVVAVAWTGCGSGGSDDGNPSDGGSSTVAASFVADEPAPAAGDVTLQEGSKSANTVSVLVNVTGVNDVYGASFDVEFDPTKVEYVGHSAGNVLESGSHKPQYLVGGSPGNGRIVVFASRVGAVAGVDVAGTGTLMRLSFRVKAEGSFPMAIEVPALLNDAATPTPITGLTWHAGSAVGVGS